MPRNSSGNYTLPAGNPVVPNTLIETTWANPTMADLGAGITDSLDRYGRGGMLAQLKLADGTAAQPAFAFNSESSTGLYRASAGVMNLSILGAVVASYAAGSVTFSQPPHYAADPASGNVLTRKSYVDASIATAVAGVPIGNYLPLTGGTLAGPGNLQVGGALGVTGAATLGGALNVASNASIQGALDVAFGIRAQGAGFLSAAASGVTIGQSGAFASAAFVSSTAALNQKVWDVQANPGGALEFRAVSDSLASAFSWLTAVRNGTSVPTVQFPISNVGIGKTAEDSASFGGAVLDVKGPVYARQADNTVATIAIGIAAGEASVLTSAPILKLWTNTVERMRIDAAGNVLVGRQAVAAYGAGYTVLSLDGSVSGVVDIWAAGVRKGVIYSSANSFNVDTNGATPLVLSTQGGSERMRIDAVGRVGIDNTAPTVIGLTVGNAATTGENYVRNLTSTNDLYFGQSAGTIFGNAPGTAGYLLQVMNAPLGIGTLGSGPLQFGTSGVERMRLDTAGNLGLNCLANNFGAGWTTLELKAKATGGLVSVLDAGGLRRGGLFYNVSDTSFNLSAFNASPLVFYTAPSGEGILERLRIDAAGLVNIVTGIGALRIAGHITRFESAEIALPSANAFLTAAHGGTRAPDVFGVVLRCKVAEYGFAVGDEVSVTSESEPPAQARAWEGGCSASAVYWVYQTGTNAPPMVLSRATYTWSACTPANWRLVFKALWL